MRFTRLVAILSALFLLAGGPTRSLALKPAASAARAKYLVLIVMDGFRPDYENLARMQHLHTLMKSGMSFTSAWAGQLESETPASHATIATGEYPRKDGVIGFGWRDPATGGFTYMPTNVGQIAAGDLYRTIEQGGVPTISDLIHQRNKKDLVISLSGEKLWASAPMGTGADYVLYGAMTAKKGKTNHFAPFAVGPNVPPARTGYTSVTEPDGAFSTQNGFAARLAVKLVDSLHPRALLLNLPATDIAGHYYGALVHPADMKPIVQGTDAAIASVMDAYKRLHIFKQTLWVVVADHGMVPGLHRVPIHSIYKAVAKSGDPSLDEGLQSSIGAIWLQNPSDSKAVASALATQHFNGVEGELYKTQTPSGMQFEPVPSLKARLPAKVLKAYLDLANTEASTNGADVLLPYQENATGLQIGKSFKGMHGGFSWKAQHIPLVISGPGVPHGVSGYPAKLVDIAPTIETLLGLPVPSGVDGVVLSPALAHATSADRAADNAVLAGRLADVHALEQHSAAQSPGHSRGE